MVREILHILFAFGFAASGNAVPCQDMNNNSCWHVVNSSNAPAFLNCKDGWEDFFDIKSLLQGATYSVQYDRGFGDGLGYPQPGTQFTCIAWLNGKQANLQFTNIDWGDRVQFLVRNGDISVFIRQYWGTNTRNIVAPFH